MIQSSDSQTLAYIRMTQMAYSNTDAGPLQLGFLMTSFRCLFYSLILIFYMLGKFNSVLVIALEVLFCRNNYEASNENTLLQRVFAFASARYLGALPVWTSVRS